MDLERREITVRIKQMVQKEILSALPVIVIITVVMGTQSGGPSALGPVMIILVLMH